MENSNDFPLTAPCNTRDVRENKRGHQLLLDYILVSFVGADAVEICEYLFDCLMDDFVTMDSTMRGFQHVLSSGSLFIHYDNKGTKDVVLLEIRGRGCRYLEQQPDHSWRVFFQRVVGMPKYVPMERYAVKRIDIAIDSFTSDTLTPTRALSYLKKTLITSRFQIGRTVHEYRIKSTELSGDSFYLGKRSSDLSILVYDKRLESGTESVWYRTELRLRNVWGMKVVAALVDTSLSFAEFVADTLRSNVQFRSSIHKRSELRRQPLAAWYLKYLACIKKLELCGLNSSLEPKAGDPDVDSRK